MMRSPCCRHQRSSSELRDGTRIPRLMKASAEAIRAIRSSTTTQAAQRLSISPHTVGDHLKAIFEKTDTRTRGELSAKLFFGEHLPRIKDDTPLGDDASFIDAPRPRAG